MSEKMNSNNRIVSVRDIDMEELLIYHEVSENQLSHYCEPEPGIFIAESFKVAMRALDAEGGNAQ